MNEPMTSDQLYYHWLEQLNQAITRLPNFDIQEIFAALTELCKLFRVCKGVTCFYDDEEKEAEGAGEVFVCYDSGEPGEPVVVKRLVTAANTVVTVTAYQTKDVEPFSDLERERVELILRMILTFMSQDRLKRIILRMTCYDRDGFRNLQYFYGELGRLDKTGRLDGMAVIRLNLKHFTLINHQLGRDGGSHVMMGYYRRLEEELGEEGTVCRLGGDNFVVICPKDRLPRLVDCLRGVPVATDPALASDGRKPPPEVTVAAAAGIFPVPKGFQYQIPGDIMTPITSAYQAAKAYLK